MRDEILQVYGELWSFVEKDEVVCDGDGKAYKGNGEDSWSYVRLRMMDIRIGLSPSSRKQIFTQIPKVVQRGQCPQTIIPPFTPSINNGSNITLKCPTFFRLLPLPLLKRR